MMKKIEKLIKPAFEAVVSAKIIKREKGKDIEIRLVNNGEICKEFKGYISSFGAAITQSGLLPALAFNHQSESGSKKDRILLMEAIFLLIKKMRNDEIIVKENLFEYAKVVSDLRFLKNQIVDATTAIKLVIRTYKLV